MAIVEWDKYALSKLGEITSSKRIFKKEYVEKGVPFYRTKEVKELANGNEIATELFISEERFNEIDEKFGSPKEGDILLTAIGTIGEIYVVKGHNKFYFKDGNVLWLKKFDSIEPYFLRYALIAFIDELQQLSRGSTYNALPINKLKNHEIFVPPIPEQKRIVALLDTVFADLEQTRAKTEQNLKNARELFDSYLQQVFSQKGDGWIEKKLIDVCVLQRGFDLPKRLRSKGKYPLVSSSGITDTHVEAKVTGPGVVTGRSGSIGNVFYIKEDFWPLNTALYIKEFHGNNEKFISWLLRYFDLSRFTSGAGVPTLNRNFVHDELVNIPVSIDEQIHLVTEIENLQDEVDEVIAVYKRKLSTIDELKKSILQKAFSGELTATA
jgi:type I restriction enzyme S subunit